MDLPEFVLARVAEREKIAKAAQARVRRWAKNTRPPWVRARENAEYIGRHAALERFEGRETPEQVLAWCAAVRAIVAEHWVSPGQTNACGTCLRDDCLDNIQQDFPCRTLRAVAGIWAGHPGFDPSWR